MNHSKKKIEVKIQRIISAPPDVVFDAWLDPKTPGTIWNAAEAFTVDAKIGGLFYWLLKETAHYGRFIDVNRPSRLQHTWMSPNTLGWESTVTVAFEPHGEVTRLTLVHSGLPDTEDARGHERGWTYFAGLFADQFGAGTRKKFNWDEAHSADRA